MNVPEIEIRIDNCLGMKFSQSEEGGVLGPGKGMLGIGKSVLLSRSQLAEAGGYQQASG